MATALRIAKQSGWWYRMPKTDKIFFREQQASPQARGLDRDGSGERWRARRLGGAVLRVTAEGLDAAKNGSAIGTLRSINDMGRRRGAVLPGSRFNTCRRRRPPAACDLSDALVPSHERAERVAAADSRSPSTIATVSEAGRPASRDARVRAPQAPPAEDVYATEVEEATAESPGHVLVAMSEGQRASFVRMCEALLPRMRAVTFGLEAEVWKSSDIDALSKVLREVAHRFSDSENDSGHGDIDPFRIKLKPGTRPINQRVYRRSPVIAAKVQVEVNEIPEAEIRRRSYSAWASPVVAVARKDGIIKITVNYKRLNDYAAVPVLHVPVMKTCWIRWAAQPSYRFLIYHKRSTELG